MRRWRPFLRLLTITVFAIAAELSHATAQPVPQAPSASSSAIRGTTTTQNQAVALAGVVVSLVRDGAEVANVVSTADGTFRFDNVAPGPYTLIVASQGFDPLTMPVEVVADRMIAVSLDLKIAGVAVTVDVVAPTTVVPSTGTLTASEGLTSRELEELGSTGGLQSALRFLISAIEVPGGVSIKGGRPSQAAVQLGPGAFVDPATGLSQVSLPDDAIDKVTVLPNPYAVEYGRFSSGLVLIQTRRATDVWRVRVNRLEPAFRTKRGQPFHIIGISSLAPRLEVGGPLVKDRLYLQQAIQYRYRSSNVASRPDDEVKTSNQFSSFTRLDANLSPSHAIVGAAGLFPAKAKLATLGTFTPPEASVNMRGKVMTASGTERSIWSDTLFSETTVEVHTYETQVAPLGRQVMELWPDTTLGNFFNRQRRATDTFQFIESLSGTGRAGRVLHQFKAGLDVLNSVYEGTSVSGPVLIRRTNGTLARRLDFTPTSTNERVKGVDLAIYAQDRVQPTDRWYVELGARFDRDGVIGRFNLTPRIGSAVLLNAAGSAVIRSGYGLFFERTPSVAGAFEALESPVDTRFEADGLTPVGPPVLMAHATSPRIRTPRSLTWDLAFDQRFNPSWEIHLGVIDRRGSGELILAPVTVGESGSIRLTSEGRSAYREGEVSVHYTGKLGVDTNVSYVYSRATADLNAFTNFYDNVLWPIIGRNAYARARTDIPHRLLARGRVTPVRDWLVVGVLDWHSGLPYSVVDDMLDFVGPRNARRFPTYVRADIGVDHRFKLGKFRPWIGVRADNAFNAFLPLDVQANTTSPAFGTFYNSEYRQLRIQVRFER